MPEGIGIKLASVSDVLRHGGPHPRVYIVPCRSQVMTLLVELIQGSHPTNRGSRWICFPRASSMRYPA